MSNGRWKRKANDDIIIALEGLKQAGYELCHPQIHPTTIDADNSRLIQDTCDHSPEGVLPKKSMEARRPHVDGRFGPSNFARRGEPRLGRSAEKPGVGARLSASQLRAGEGDGRRDGGRRKSI
ncbi:predicted protein [Coccidioides posadasii str. Silveira]|uniref:Predicted protein n=1 Tax=Coccidioides posadasii (strain RMSCC 757 / Silveira) TaxID=443226 RepID=E9D8H6_COCPS|nr:predicted protein [Coccidioides posadasii str. Silveira]